MRTAILIICLGFGTLLAGRFGGPDVAGPVAALVPPWQAGGMARAAMLGLPVIDIRLGGHLLVLDASGGAEALQGQGLWLMPGRRDFAPRGGKEMNGDDYNGR